MKVDLQYSGGSIIILGNVSTPYSKWDPRINAYRAMGVHYRDIMKYLIESEFSQKFNALRTPWKLTREPEPITTGNSILIPDFAFGLGTTKICMEILGFWTREYLKRKIEKLSTIKDKPFILAVNEELACEKLTKLSEFKIIYYKQQVPLKKNPRRTKEARRNRNNQTKHHLQPSYKQTHNHPSTTRNRNRPTAQGNTI